VKWLHDYGFWALAQERVQNAIKKLLYWKKLLFYCSFNINDVTTVGFTKIRNIHDEYIGKNPQYEREGIIHNPYVILKTWERLEEIRSTKVKS
jgi:hypothetical protein